MSSNLLLSRVTIYGKTDLPLNKAAPENLKLVNNQGRMSASVLQEAVTNEIIPNKTAS